MTSETKPFGEALKEHLRSCLSQPDKKRMLDVATAFYNALIQQDIKRYAENKANGALIKFKFLDVLLKAMRETVSDTLNGYLEDVIDLIKVNEEPEYVRNIREINWSWAFKQNPIPF